MHKKMSGPSMRNMVGGGKLEKEDSWSVCEKPRSVYYFSRVGVTKYRKLSGLKHQTFVFSSFWRLDI